MAFPKELVFETIDEFKEFKFGMNTIFYFYGTFCVPCKSIKPVWNDKLAKLLASKVDMIELDISKGAHHEIHTDVLGLKKIPHFYALVNGVGHAIQTSKEDELMKFIKEHYDLEEHIDFVENNDF